MKTFADFDLYTQQLIVCVYFFLFFILKNKKKKLFCAFVIFFEKAFDTVWRDALWYNMLLNNINGHMYQVISNMYQNIKSCLFYMQINPNIFHVKKDPKREDVYPFLFSLFFIDLENVFIHENVPRFNSISVELDSRFDIFMKLFIILYADDAVLMA
jgi:hypothetical protein